MNRTAHILLVEDNSSDVELAKIAFERIQADLKLHIVGNGEEAMKFLRRDARYNTAPRPGLILMDLNMPFKGGHETLLEIKGNHDYKEIPVVIFTTSDAENDISFCYKNDANAYVVKPTRFTHLKEYAKTFYHFWFNMAAPLT